MLEHQNVGTSEKIRLKETVQYNLKYCQEKKCWLENPGIDPGTSHMLSERSTI